MPDLFPAYLVEKHEDGLRARQVEFAAADLPQGNVTVQVEWSTLNYKDALALTGRAPVIRRFPLIPGIDFAGRVVESTDTRFAVGDPVLLNGWGVGEVHHGGYASFARVPGDWLTPMPQGLTARQAMAVGTAGYTAMLCVLVLQESGLRPEHGKVLVTGATGGVGSIALALLNDLGFEVVAVTGKPQEHAFLESLGAKQVLARSELSGKAPPLGKELWAGAIDVAGGNTLANLLSQMQRGSTLAACGLADSMDLPASIAPFILRGIALQGVDSVMAPNARRQLAWEGIVRHLSMDLLESLVTEIAFEQLPDCALQLLDGGLRGRVLVQIPSV